MAPRREGEQNPYWKRMEVVMKVFMGQMNVTEAARELGITRAYYYQLEEEMLRAALGAVTPSKPGPKTTPLDPGQVKKAEELEKVRREKELLEIKVKHLEELQRDMITRGLGVLKEKKRRRRTQVRRRHGKKIHGPVPAIGTVETGGTTAPGRDDQRPLPGAGAQPGQSVPMEGQGGRQEARPTDPAGRGGRRDGLGSPSLRSSEGRDLGSPSDLRGPGRDHSSKLGEYGA